MQTWIYLEITAFFLQICSGAFFLLYVQLRGLFGKKTHVPDDEDQRHNSDSLSYYSHDIGWSNLIFVTLVIHVLAFLSNLDSDNQTASATKLTYSGIMIAGRVLQIYFFLPFRNARREHVPIPPKVWAGFTILEVVGLILVLTFKSYRGITAATSVVEVAVFIGQWAQHRVVMRRQAKKEEE